MRSTGRGGRRNGVEKGLFFNVGREKKCGGFSVARRTRGGREGRRRRGRCKRRQGWRPKSLPNLRSHKRTASIIPDDERRRTKWQSKPRGLRGCFSAAVDGRRYGVGSVTVTGARAATPMQERGRGNGTEIWKQRAERESSYRKKQTAPRKTQKATRYLCTYLDMGRNARIQRSAAASSDPGYQAVLHRCRSWPSCPL